MFVIKNNILPIGKGYKAINLFGIIFVKNGKRFNNVDENHESIHSYQLIEMGLSAFIFIFVLALITNISFWWLLLSPCAFYIWYGIEYLIVRCFHKKQNDAYHDVSFEEEAYANEHNLTYLKSRKLFSWFKYIKIKSYVGKQR